MSDNPFDDIRPAKRTSRSPEHEKYSELVMPVLEQFREALGYRSHRYAVEDIAEFEWAIRYYPKRIRPLEFYPHTPVRVNLKYDFERRRVVGFVCSTGVHKIVEYEAGLSRDELIKGLKKLAEHLPKF